MENEPTVNPTSLEPTENVADERRLAELGYAQELKRGWSVLESFGVSFAVISVITGQTTLFGYGLATGGPATMAWGWIIVCLFSGTVALSMAEIVSAIPSSAGPFHWAAFLSSRRHAPLATWVTAWFNLLGQVAVTTGISFGAAGLMSTLISYNVDSFVSTPGTVLGLYAALLLTHGIVNTAGVGTLTTFNRISIAIHSLGIGALAIALLVKAPKLQPASFVFNTFYDGTGVGDADGWSIRASKEYVGVAGLLFSQYTITGYDASAHLAEETHNAARNAPIGVLTAVGASAVFGFFTLLAFLFSIQDLDAVINSATGQPVLQILIDAFGPGGATVLMSLIIIAVWHCGLFSMCACSRQMYAFSRDGGLPKFFNHVDNKFSAPTRTIWLTVFLSFCLALPSLGSSVAFAAATSIATIGLYLSYGIPIAIGIFEHRRFSSVKGPFSLGRLSRPIGTIASLWIVFIAVAFCLPTQNPVTLQTFNYTPVAVGIILVWIFASWVFWARFWFKGPHMILEMDEVATQDSTGMEEKNEGMSSVTKVLTE